MRQTLLKIAASLGLLSVFFVALLNSCDHSEQLGPDKAGLASLNANRTDEGRLARALPSESSIKSSSPVESNREKVGVPRRARQARKHVLVSGMTSMMLNKKIGDVVANDTSRRSSKEALSDTSRTANFVMLTESHLESLIKRDLISKELARIKRISAEELKASATNCPEPSFPPIARAEQVSGVVDVELTIDESGAVISARAISGHPLLQDAAVEAAKRWTFSPFVIDGTPAKVIGIITFNFVL